MVSADDDANHLAYTMPAPLVQHSGLGRISRQEGHPLHSLPQKLDGLSKRHCCSNLDRVQRTLSNGSLRQ